MINTDAVTFGLAWLGYAFLGAGIARRANGRPSRAWDLATAAVVVAHVACVYAFRFDGSIAAAWNKSPPGFLIFHAALALIVTVPLVPEQRRALCALGAFGIASAGVLPAAFRYEEIAMLALPNIAVFVATVALTVRGWRGRGHARPAAP